MVSHHKSENLPFPFHPISQKAGVEEPKMNIFNFSGQPMVRVLN